MLVFSLVRPSRILRSCGLAVLRPAVCGLRFEKISDKALFKREKMANLKSEQVKELADNLLRMTNALGDYRYENFERLSEDENRRIKELHERQLSHTTELYTKSAVLVMDDVETSLKQIDTITLETQKLYKNLTTVQKVLDRATSVLTLAVAIIGLDPKGITSSIKGLLAKTA